MVIYLTEQWRKSPFRFIRAEAELLAESLNESLGVSCDKEFFICGNYPDFDLAVGSGNSLKLSSQTLVCSLVELNAEEFHVGAYIFAEIIGIFADSAGEDNCVKTVHYSGIGANVLLDFVAEHIACELSLLVAVLCSCGDVAVVARNSRNSEESGLLVKIIAHLGGIHVHLILDERYSGRIHTAGTCSHDYTVKGSEAH